MGHINVEVSVANNSIQNFAIPYIYGQPHLKPVPPLGQVPGFVEGYALLHELPVFVLVVLMPQNSPSLPVQTEQVLRLYPAYLVALIPTHVHLNIVVRVYRLRSLRRPDVYAHLLTPVLRRKLIAIRYRRVQPVIFSMGVVWDAISIHVRHAVPIHYNITLIIRNSVIVEIMRVRILAVRHAIPVAVFRTRALHRYQNTGRYLAPGLQVVVRFTLIHVLREAHYVLIWCCIPPRVIAPVRRPVHVHAIYLRLRWLRSNIVSIAHTVTVHIQAKNTAHSRHKLRAVLRSARIVHLYLNTPLHPQLPAQLDVLTRASAPYYLTIRVQIYPHISAHILYLQPPNVHSIHVRVVQVQRPYSGALFGYASPYLHLTHQHRPEKPYRRGAMVPVDHLYERACKQDVLGDTQFHPFRTTGNLHTTHTLPAAPVVRIV